MKKLSQKLLADMVSTSRKNKQMTQNELAAHTGINRTMIGRIEKEDYVPSIDQLQALAETLDFDITTLFVEDKPVVEVAQAPMKKIQHRCRWYRLRWFIHRYTSRSAQPRYSGRYHS